MPDATPAAASASAPLLTGGDPPPFAVVNPAGRSRVVLIGDHAGNAVPGRLGALGLPEAELGRHIGWDLGVRELGAFLAERLDAVFVHQTYSRLVIDCNRDPSVPGSIVEASDGTAVPGNQALGASERAARHREIFAPYQARIGEELDARRAPVLVALHSFTPQLRGAVARPWHFGVLHDRGDTTLSHALLAALRKVLAAAAIDPATVGDNEPYEMDGTDFTVPFHAYPRALPYAEIECRQDLLATPAGITTWATHLASALSLATGGVWGGTPHS